MYKTDVCNYIAWHKDYYLLSISLSFVAVCLFYEILPAKCSNHLIKIKKPHESIGYDVYRTSLRIMANNAPQLL